MTTEQEYNQFKKNMRQLVKDYELTRDGQEVFYMFDNWIRDWMPIEEEKEDLKSALYRIISENKPYTCWHDYDKPVEEILKLINK